MALEGRRGIGLLFSTWALLNTGNIFRSFQSSGRSSNVIFIDFIENFIDPIFYLILTCFVETVVNLWLLGLVLLPVMYSALDHFMGSRAI